MCERSHSLCMADYGDRRGWKMRMESAGKRRDIPMGRTGHGEKTGHYKGNGMGYVIFCGRFY